MNKDNNNAQACDLSYLLEEKLGAFNAFLSATALLRDAGDFLEMEKIETLIAERESCIKVIKGIDKRINRIRNFIPAVPPESVKRAKPLTKAIDYTAAKAARLNKEFETMFTFHHNELRDRLSETHHRRDGVSNYAAMARGGNQPRFLDVRS